MRWSPRRHSRTRPGHGDYSRERHAIFDELSLDDVQDAIAAEEALVSETAPSRRLPRVVAARAFWFEWYAQFPETRLIR